MNLLFLGMTFGVIGKAMLGIGVVMVHVQMARERSIDAAVIRSFHTELIITTTGLFLIVLGYLLEITFFGGFSHLLTCQGAECAAAIGAAFSQ